MSRRQLLMVLCASLFLLAPRARADERADLKKRFEERYPTLVKLKDAGKVGETIDGRVLTVKDEYGKEKVDRNDPKSLTITQFLELENKEDVSKVQAVLPRIIDNFQVYLRELRIEDLRGSAGLYRLREELLTRVATAAAPAKVSDVLFKEMLVQ